MARRLAVSRRDQIRAKIDRYGVVSVGDLSLDLGVSRETIRRDLKQMADQGELAVVHGGATRRDRPRPAQGPAGQNGAADAVARAAANLVGDGDVVLLDAGAMTLAIAGELSGKERLTIITNGLTAASALAPVPGFRVVILGGEVDGADHAVVGVDTMEMLRNYRVDIAFIAAEGIAPDGQPTDRTRIGAEQRKRMIEVAARAYVVADVTCFGNGAPIRIGGLSGVTGVILDRTPASPIAAAIADRGFELVVG